MQVHKLLLASLIVIVFLGAGCIAPGSNKEIVSSSYLPDHITEVFGETLPQAILEARERGKSSVTVTDPSGNIVKADISDNSKVVYTITDPVLIDDPIAELIKSSVPVEKAYDIKREGGTFSFALNQVQHKDIATIMYEVSVRIFKVPSTQQWTIDIE